MATRRQFLVSAALVAAGCARSPGRALPGRPLLPTRDETTGLSLLSLPEGFRYRSFGWTGETMADGFPTPPLHDGMGVVTERSGQLILVRNHEVVNQRGVTSPTDAGYDDAASGGTTTLSFDSDRGEWGQARYSLTGTLANCAGGVTPWGTWLSCEEAVADTDGRLGPRFNNAKMRLNRRHGYVFEVPAEGAASARPLTALGRFRHEAVAVDAATGIAYLTEDNQPVSGMFRFVPEEPGSFEAGSLEMLATPEFPDLRQDVPVDRWFAAQWVGVDDPDLGHTPGTLDSAGVYGQGKRQGGSTFRRLEGCWMGAGQVFFTDTTGGREGHGQIFVFDPDRQALKLLFESDTRSVLDHPDNITVSPGGGLLICEDAPGNRQRLLAFNPDTGPVPFAENTVVLSGEVEGIRGNFRGAEWAGACFSADGRWLFANIQSPGITVAITGPWEFVGL